NKNAVSLIVFSYTFSLSGTVFRYQSLRRVQRVSGLGLRQTWLVPHCTTVSPGNSLNAFNGLNTVGFVWPLLNGTPREFPFALRLSSLMQPLAFRIKACIVERLPSQSESCPILG